MTSLPAATRVARATASYGLGGSLPLPSAPLDAASWAALVGYCVDQRIPGHLLQAALDGALPTTDEQLAAAQEAHLGTMWTALHIERALLQVADMLDAAGVDFRVLKGSACASLDYPDRSLRAFGDVDLLVTSEQFDTAAAALAAHGVRRCFAEPRPGFDRRFSKGASFVTIGDVEIDLHRTFVLGPFGLHIDLRDLWLTSSPFEIGGRTLHALGREERFMHACYHAALGQSVPRLVPLRDIAEMLIFGDLDEARVHELISRWAAAPVIARAVRLAWETLGVTVAVPLSAWALAYQPGPRERRALSVYTSGRNSYSAKSWAALRAIPRVRDRVAFVSALTFPQQSYLEDHQQRGVVVRWWRAAAGLRDRRVTS